LASLRNYFYKLKLKHPIPPCLDSAVEKVWMFSLGMTGCHT
jgi:hypothetical protein